MTDTQATKQDLSEFRYVLHEVQIRMDARFEAKLTDLERRLTMRLGTVTVAAIGAVSAIVRLL